MDSIPQELLERIICYLFPILDESSLKDTFSEKEAIHIGRKDLYNVMASCKAFYRTARPAFYHTISFRDPDSEIFEVQRLIRVCIDRPDTASYVREIRLGEWGGCTLCDIHRSEAVSSNLEPFRTASEKINVPLDLRADIQVGLGQGSHAAFVALLLSLCLNLDSISATNCFVHSSLITRLAEELTTRDLTGKAEDVRPLQRLRKFRTYCSHFEHFTDITTFIPYLRLPLLRVFEGIGVQGNDGLQGLSTRFTSKLRSLELYAAFDSTALDWLLTICPDLVEIVIRIWSVYGRCEPHPEAIGDILRRHGSRIERLVIRLWRRPDLAIEADRDDEVLGSLTTMEKLHTLHVPWAVLFGYTLFNDGFSTQRAASEYLEITLPRSLKELEISSTPHDSIYIRPLDGQLQALMESERFKQLRFIRVCRTEPYSLQCQQQWHSRVDKSLPDRWGSVQTSMVLWRASEVSFESSSYT